MMISRTDWNSLVTRVQENDPQLTELNFSRDKIEDPKYLEVLSAALKANSYVVALDLGTNPITLDGLRALGSTLQTNCTLIKLILPEDYANPEIKKVADAVLTTLYQTAFKSANQGNAFAQYWVGYCNALANGISQDLSSAISWYEKSAAQQNVEAEYLLGVSLSAGVGTEVNREKAVKLFTKLAEKGHLGAMCSLVEYFTTHEKNLERAIFWCKKAADLGDAAAQRYLGQLYLVENSMSRGLGVLYLKEAAKQGDQESNQILNHMKSNPDSLVESSLLTDVLQQNVAEKSHLTTPEQMLSYLNTLNQYDQQRKELENRINVLEQQTKNSNKDAIEHELLMLKAKQEVLLADYNVKEQRKATVRSFQSSPNLWNHYRTLNISLENVFIGCKAVASEFIETSLTGNMTTAATAISFATKLCTLVPVVGDALDMIASAVSTGLEQADQMRQTNILKTMASLGTLSEIKKSAESTARKLTERYYDQLQQLPTEEIDKPRPDAIKEAPPFGKVLQEAKEAVDAANALVLKRSTSTAAERLADFAMSQIVGALLDGAIDTSNPLDDQFIASVTNPPSRLDKLKQAISAKLGVGTLTTIDDRRWQLEHIYRKPGIKTSQGVCYGGKDSLPVLYGYRLGTEEEALALCLIQEEQPAAIPLTATSTTKPSTPPTPQPSPDAHASSMDVNEKKVGCGFCLLV